MRITERAIEGYWGYYYVDNKGRIFSLKNNMYLKPEVSGGGYLRVQLSKNGEKQKFLVHRLVAQYFVKNKEGKPEVNHKDGNKLNNKSSNLEWVTRKENEQHSSRMGLKPVGMKNGNAKYSDEKIREVLSLCESDLTRKEISKLTGVSENYIGLLVAKKYRQYAYSTPGNH